MRDRASLMIRGDKLQPELTAALDGSEAGAVYEVRIRRASAQDAAYFLETRAKVQEGLADIEAGDVLPADDVHAELEKKFNIVFRR